MAPRFSTLGFFAAFILAAPLMAAPTAFYDLDASTDAEDGSITSSGVTASLVAVVTGGTSNGVGALNQGSNDFGVNTSTAAIPDPAPANTDITSQLDYRDGIESIVVSFDRAVFLLSIDVQAFSSDDQGTVTFSNGNSPVLVNASGTNLMNVLIPLGHSFTITYSGTQLSPGTTSEGFDFAGFTIVVPEPASAALLALGAPMMLRRRR